MSDWPSAWVLWTIVAVVFSGSRHAWRHWTANRLEHPNVALLLSSAVTVLLGIVVIEFVRPAPPDLWQLLILSVLCGMAYAFASIFGMRAQRHVAYETFQALTHNGNLIAIPILILVFNERPSPAEWTAICATLAALLMLGGRDGATEASPLWLPILCTTMAYAVLTLINKFVTGTSSRVDPIYLIIASNVVVIMTTAVPVLKDIGGGNAAGIVARGAHRPLLWYGIVAGVLNFLAFFAMLEAYAAGNDSAATIAALLTASVFVASTLESAFPARRSSVRRPRKALFGVMLIVLWAIGVILFVGESSCEL